MGESPESGAALPAVLVVEDDADACANLEAWLTCSGFRVWTAGDALAGLAIAKREPIDVVVSDLRLPGANGLDLLALLKSWDPEVPVILMSGVGTLDDAIAALRGRAFDFLKKPLADMYQLNLALERALASRARPATAVAPGGRTPSAPLSPRDHEILRLVVQGHGNDAIAERLGLSAKTVRNNLSLAFQKLGVANRTEAAFVYTRRVVGPDVPPPHAP